MTTYHDLLARVSASAAEGRELREPATGDVYGHAPVHTPADLDAAIAAARAAQPAWAALSPEERGAVLHRTAARVEEAGEALAELLSREVGKPLNFGNSRLEVEATIGWLHATAETELPREVVVDEGVNRSELVYQPIGVVGAIGPWNWPVMVGTWQIAAALKAGNAVVVKPSEFTPLSVLALISLLNEELPSGLLTGISGDRTVGAHLAAHPGVGKIMFTGSTATGRRIIESSAANITRLTLELGGNDPGIVLPGSDPAAIAEGLFQGAFANTGQTCAALKRLYVHDSIYDDVVERLAQLARNAKLGPVLDEDTVFGPLQNKQQFDIVAGLVEDARSRDARIVTGGAPATELGALYYPITIVADIDDGTALVDEEQFGPALPVIRYSDVEEAISRANRLDVGLGASVWGPDPEQNRRVAERIEAGTVWINAHGVPHPFAPFGGVKSSGYGLEFGVEGLKAVSVPKLIATITPPVAEQDRL